MFLLSILGKNVQIMILYCFPIDCMIAPDVSQQVSMNTRWLVIACHDYSGVMCNVSILSM